MLLLCREISLFAKKYQNVDAVLGVELTTVWLKCLLGLVLSLGDLQPLRRPDPSLLWGSLGVSPGSPAVDAEDYLQNSVRVGSKAIELCSTPGTFLTLARVLKPGNLLMMSISHHHSIDINIWTEVGLSGFWEFPVATDIIPRRIWPCIRGLLKL